MALPKRSRPHWRAPLALTAAECALIAKWAESAALLPASDPSSAAANARARRILAKVRPRSF